MVGAIQIEGCKNCSELIYNNSEIIFQIFKWVNYSTLQIMISFWHTEYKIQTYRHTLLSTTPHFHCFIVDINAWYDIIQQKILSKKLFILKFSKLAIFFYFNQLFLFILCYWNMILLNIPLLFWVKLRNINCIAVVWVIILSK